MGNLLRSVLAIVVLAGCFMLAVNIGALPTLVSFTSYVFGDKAGQALEAAGEDAANPQMPDVSLEDWFPSDAAETIEQAPTIPAVRIPDYDRDAFGKAWADADKNGCDTRNDILARDLTNITKEGSCKVLTGVLADPYTGKTINFQRGTKTSSAVQIDHVVPLSWSWKAGSWQWSDEQRLTFANDPLNLMAADGPTNSGKGDKGPSAWMPPNQSFHCDYATRFSAVVAKYALSLGDADRTALTSTLSKCA